MFSFSLLIAVAAAMPPPFDTGTDRGVFVYGHLVLDFWRRSEEMGRRYTLRNCSTETLYCADGELFNIVLPRFCRDIDIRPGTVWRQGDLETTVIGQERVGGAGHWSPGTTYELYYLHTNVRPDIIYAYSPNRGVIKLYYDVRREIRPSEAVDFVAMARRGELLSFSREIIGDLRRQHLSLGLLTLDQFAVCLGEEFRNRTQPGEAPDASAR